MKKKKMPLYKFIIFILIPIIPIIVFWIIPMIVSLLISFTDWDYISPKYNIVGINNYIELLGDSAFYQALKTTIIFGLGTVLPTLIIGFLLALLLIKNIKIKNFFRGMIFSPWITPMVAMSIVWSWMFRQDVGLINKVLKWFGIIGPNWLSDSSTAIYAIIIVTVWKNAGWAMLFYLDSFSKIPKSLIEVCNLEGLGFMEKIRSLYIPLSKKTTFFLLMITLIDSIQAYDQINVLTQGGPSGSTRTLLYLFYFEAFERFNMGRATSVAVIIVIITSVLALIMRYVSRRAEEK